MSSKDNNQYANVIDLAERRHRAIHPDTDTEVIRDWLGDIRDLAMQIDVLLTLREQNKGRKAN